MIIGAATTFSTSAAVAGIVTASLWLAADQRIHLFPRLGLPETIYSQGTVALCIGGTVAATLDGAWRWVVFLAVCAVILAASYFAVDRWGGDL